VQGAFRDGLQLSKAGLEGLKRELMAHLPQEVVKSFPIRLSCPRAHYYYFRRCQNVRGARALACEPSYSFARHKTPLVARICDDVVCASLTISPSRSRSIC
jgi:hypothetical protein